MHPFEPLEPLEPPPPPEPQQRTRSQQPTASSYSRRARLTDLLVVVGGPLFIRLNVYLLASAGSRQLAAAAASRCTWQPGEEATTAAEAPAQAQWQPNADDAPKSGNDGASRVWDCRPGRLAAGELALGRRLAAGARQKRRRNCFHCRRRQVPLAAAGWRRRQRRRRPLLRPAADRRARLGALVATTRAPSASRLAIQLASESSAQLSSPACAPCLPCLLRRARSCVLVIGVFRFPLAALYVCQRGRSLARSPDRRARRPAHERSCRRRRRQESRRQTAATPAPFAPLLLFALGALDKYMTPQPASQPSSQPDERSPEYSCCSSLVEPNSTQVSCARALSLLAPPPAGAATPPRLVSPKARWHPR